MKTFTYKAIVREGKTFHLLTADQYPWSNLQVVTFAPVARDESLAKLHNVYGSWVETVAGHDDFAIIQAGGSSHPVRITQDNAMQVAADIRACMQAAASWWVKNGPSI